MADHEQEGFVDFEEIYDPAIASTISHGQQRQADARLSKEARQKKIKERRKEREERERAKARLAGRVNWDLPPWLKERIVDRAKREGVPISQLAAALLIEGLAQYEAQQIDLDKIPSASPKFDFLLSLPKLKK